MEKTHIGKAIQIADKKAQYDAQIKNVLSNKWILAHILKATAIEVKGLSIEEIVACINDDIKVGKVPVNPGETNAPDAIVGDNVEDKVPYEGMIVYDIRFHMYVGDENNEIKLLINIEAQKGKPEKYPIVTRAIVYGSRMISAQIDTEIKKSNYQDLKKVYSVWICMNAPNYIGNAMQKFSIEKADVVGEVYVEEQSYDKMNILLIYLNEKKDKGEADIFHLLNTLLSPDKTVTEKEDILENQFNIPINEDYSKELSEMCNLSEAVEERGTVRGEIKKVILLIKTNAEKNRKVEDVADFLGEDIELVKRIYGMLGARPCITVDEIYEEVYEDLEDK